MSPAYQPPPSKSFAIRALMIASLAEGRSEVLGPGSSGDVRAALAAVEKWRTVRVSGDKVAVSSRRKPFPPGGTYHAGGSATLARFLLALFSVTGGDRIIDGDASLRRRDMSASIRAARSVGAEVTETKKKGRFPLRILGSGRYPERSTIDDRSSSQFASGMLIAAPLYGNRAVLSVAAPVSFPYVRMTAGVMRLFGVPVTCRGSSFTVGPGRYSGAAVKTEADYSAAAFLMAGAAMTGRTLAVDGLAAGSLQGDAAMIGILKGCGVSVRRERGLIKVEGSPSAGLNVDLKDTPDLFPPLAALALKCPAPSFFTGMSRLKEKESPRGEAMASAISSIGGKAVLKGDSLKVIPASSYQGAPLDPRGDHRVAMAFGLMALLADGTAVLGHECVSKSYPSFWKDLGELI